MSNRRNKYKAVSPAKTGEIKHITTKSGFQCDIPLERLDSWEVMEAIAESGDSDRGQIKALITLANLLLHESGKARLMEHVRLPDGRIPFSAMDREITEIFLLLNTQTKNSVSSPG